MIDEMEQAEALIKIVRREHSEKCRVYPCKNRTKTVADEMPLCRVHLGVYQEQVALGIQQENAARRQEDSEYVWYRGFPELLQMMGRISRESPDVSIRLLAKGCFESVLSNLKSK